MKQINTGKGRRKKKCIRGTKSELLTGWEAAVHEASLAQMVKNLPAMQETWIRSLGQEDPLEKGLAIDFSILAWRIPRIEEPDRLQFVGSQRVGHD